MTIVQAIIKVLEEAGKPLDHNEIYDQIVKDSLFEFKAQDPVAVLKARIRKHCHGVDFRSASPNKYFLELRNSGEESKVLYELWNGEPG